MKFKKLSVFILPRTDIENEKKQMIYDLEEEHMLVV
jgi:hypothetical protein